ncbi:hypothetical protein CIHG_06794 [Coccidioides immitis H538.4]|uniref:Uncharacterized protein n=3 Tax=Coccidioides immitis TaxID=5501 RepID=A0A0J8R4Y9_COCIT|nr:hypothetical protein CIRG_04347 [Coccidioides immitis RMSCC 2394]KMU80174.1 hypothetical protein CISG_08282 [Coccidioides immitis RMSCC 3703]KMU88993.1 hypothetical protein CIHG_06794 [Coccidioides immitis H538.4]
MAGTEPTPTAAMLVMIFHDRMGIAFLLFIPGSISIHLLSPPELRKTEAENLRHGIGKLCDHRRRIAGRHYDPFLAAVEETARRTEYGEQNKKRRSGRKNVS